MSKKKFNSWSLGIGGWKLFGHWLLVIGIFLLWNVYVLSPLLFHAAKPDIGHIVITDRHDQPIADLPRPDGLQIPLGDDEPIPDNIKNAFETIEDSHFESHWGVDIMAKLRALRDNFDTGKVVSGGSTITEQWLKNEYFSHSPRTILQKLREANLALYASLFVSKDEVLRHYLDSIYFGQRNYGIKAAMKAYFDKSHLETLTNEEIVTLLAIIRSPGVVNTHEKTFTDRWNRIWDILHPNIPYVPNVPSLKPYQGFNRFPHVTATIVAEIPTTNYDLRTPIPTTIDSALQTKAEQLINESLDRLAGKNVTNGAAYVVDPRNGDILVWVGSRDFNSKTIDGQVNVITQPRQMGSALKPFIYLYAFLQGAHPDQLIVDLEKDFESGKEDEAYRPLNYGLREGGVMPLKLALASSFNISAVRLLQHLGLEPVYQFMKGLGLPFDHDADYYGYSLALGSPDLPMQAVADAYGSLANNGVPIRSHLIRAVIPTEVEGSLTQAPVRDSSATSRVRDSGRNDNLPYFYLFDTLSNPLNRRRSFGVNSILNTSIPFAVKTGTTKDFHDNWAFGYRPDLVVAVWVGNNDSSPMVDVDGITGAGPIWHRIVEAAIEQGIVSHQEIPAPSPLVQTQKCLNASCSQTDLIYQEPGRSWQSDLISGHYCLEDFYIKDIDPAEIAKVAKLFNFKDFQISNCNSPSSPSSPSSPPNPLLILSPTPNEIFTIRPEIPPELQKIILRASEDAEWFVDDARVGSGKSVFIAPALGNHRIVARTGDNEQEVSITINESP